MLIMGQVIQLAAWRPARTDADDDMDRLELALQRLDPIVAEAIERHGGATPAVETELLAIVGSLSLDLVEDAAVRTERLADRLQRERRLRKRG